METRASSLLFLSLLIVLMTSAADLTPPTLSSIRPAASRQESDFTTKPTAVTLAPETLTPETPTGSTTGRTPSSSPSVNVSTVLKTNPPPTPPSTATPQTTPLPASRSSSWLVAILLLIVVLAVFVGCVHCLRERRANGDGSAPRLLLDMRERLRTGIGNLEDRLGVQLWPEGKSAGEDEEEDVEEGGNDNEEDEGRLTKVKDEQGHEEDSDTSSEDNSSIEGGDGSVVALDSQSPERNLAQVQVQQKSSEEKIRDSTGSSQEEGRQNTAPFDVTAL